MKKYMKMVGNILLYTMTYLLLQMAAGMVMGIMYTVKYFGTLTELEIQDKLMEDIFIGVAISAICAFIIYMLLLRKKEENLFQRCSFKRVSLREFIYVLFASMGLSAISSSFVLINYEKFESYEEVASNINAGLSTMIGTFCIIVLIPIFEEILFRGLVMNEVKKHTGIAMTIALQSLIFAIYHGNALQGIYTFILGIILGVIYLWSKNLWIPILMHITYNLLGTLIFPVLLYYTEPYLWVYIIAGLIILFMSMTYLYKKRIISLSIEATNE